LETLPDQPRVRVLVVDDALDGERLRARFGHLKLGTVDLNFQEIRLYTPKGST
jgi:hypothetical protein